MPKLDVDGVGLAYDDVGRRDGVPLVFIHGWTANRHRWDDQLGHFAGRYRVISLDLRGHGDSDSAPNPYTIGGLAREVLALLDGLGVDRFVPVGHSMGGMIALTLALEHPERVEQLVLVDSLGRMMYSRGRGLLILLSRLLPCKMFVAVNIRRAFKPGFPSAEVARYVAQAQSTPRQVVLGCFAAMRRFDVLDHVCRLKLPMLILHGFYDAQLPLRQALRIAVQVPDSLVKVLDTGHEAPAEDPEALTRAVESFLRTTCSASDAPPRQTTDVHVRPRCVSPTPPTDQRRPAGRRGLPVAQTPRARDAAGAHACGSNTGGDTGGMADVAWEELRVEVHGRPVFVRRGPEVPGSVPLVHVHGFAVSGSYLLPTARALAHRATTLVPDLPGYGHTAAWGHALGIPSLAWALLELLDALGLERVVLVGNSMGGPVCLEVAHSAPERVTGIVLASPAGGMHNQPLARALLQLTRDARRENPRMVRVVLPDYLRFGPVNALQLFGELMRFPSLERIVRTPVPTLAVVGTRDPLMPPSWRVREVGRLAPPHVTVAVIEGAAHAMNFSHPGELAHVIGCWLDGREITDDPNEPGRARVLEIQRGDP
jgi:pimeloyl-ACP methyl ester carboxylesterase